MELTQAEKDRILAEERCRLEAKRQLDLEHHSCGGTWFHRGGFWRGFLLGIVLSALAALLMHHHRHCRWERGYGQGRGCYGQGCHAGGPWSPERNGCGQDNDK